MKYEFMWMLVIYGFAGWLLETVVASVKRRRFVYRGFLTLPFCPVYAVALGWIEAITRGFNMTGAIKIITTVLLSFVSAFVFEFALNFLFSKIIGKKWWSREKEKINIKGYVGAISVVINGACTSLILIFIQPIFSKLVETKFDIVTNDAAFLVAFFTSLAIVLDGVYSIMEAVNLNRKLKTVKKLDKILNSVNDDATVRVYKKTEDLGECRDEFNKLARRSRRIIASNDFTYKRWSCGYSEIEDKEMQSLLEDFKHLYKIYRYN